MECLDGAVLKASASCDGCMWDPERSGLERGDGGLVVARVSGPSVNPSGRLRGSLVSLETWDSIRESRRRPFPSQSTLGGGRPSCNKKKDNKLLPGCCSTSLLHLVPSPVPCSLPCSLPSPTHFRDLPPHPGPHTARCQGKYFENMIAASCNLSDVNITLN